MGASDETSSLYCLQKVQNFKARGVRTRLYQGDISILYLKYVRQPRREFESSAFMMLSTMDR